MDAEITLEKYCKNNNINYTNVSDDEWDGLVNMFENEIDNYLRACFEEGNFNMFLKGITENIK